MSLSDELYSQSMDFAVEARKQQRAAKEKWLIDNIKELVDEPDGEKFSVLISALRKNQKDVASVNAVNEFLHIRGFDLRHTQFRMPNIQWNMVNVVTISLYGKIVRRLEWQSKY